MTPEDLSGRKFGFLTVIERAEKTPLGLQRWRCLCVCGRTCVAAGGDLKRRPNASCGCQHRRLASEANKTHGHVVNKKPSPEYHSWQNMRARCLNKNHPRYGDYGGRGIRICKRWRDSFENFLSDMGGKPSRSHTIERKDNDGPYSPGNCRWATKKEQNQNTRASHFLAHVGITLTIAQWSERTGLPASVIQTRISRGWTAEESLTIPASKTHKISHIRGGGLITVNGESLPLSQWSRRSGLSISTIHNRIRRGWPHAEAVSRVADLGNRWIRVGHVTRLPSTRTTC